MLCKKNHAANAERKKEKHTLCGKKNYAYANYGIPCNSSTMKSFVNEKSCPVFYSSSLRTKTLLLLQISTNASMTGLKRAFTVRRDFVASGSRGDSSPDSFAID